MPVFDFRPLSGMMKIFNNNLAEFRTPRARRQLSLVLLLLSLHIFNKTAFLQADRDSQDIQSHEFKLTNFQLNNDLLDKNALDSNYGEDYNEDVSYDSGENEIKRMEKNRRIFEMAGARFSPIFEPLKKSTKLDMNDI